MSLIAFSIGAMQNIFSFLSQRQIIRLQLTNRRFYSIYCQNAMRWTEVPTLKNWSQLSSFYLKKHQKLGADAQAIAPNVHKISLITNLQSIVVIQALERVYQVQGDSCLLLDSYPLPPNQVKVISIYSSQHQLYVLHEGSHVIIYKIADGKIVSAGKHISFAGKAFKMMIEDKLMNNLVLFGHQTGFTVVNLENMTVRGSFAMEIEMISGKQISPQRTGEIMSLHLQRADQHPIKLICLFNFGLFSVHIPRNGSEVNKKCAAAKFQFGQEEQKLEECSGSAIWRILFKTTMKEIISNFYEYKPNRATIISSGKLKLIQLEPPQVLLTLMMANEGVFDNSFHKCSPLDEHDSSLERYILTCNPFQIMLVDTFSRDVFTLAKVKASHNYMNESFSIITGGQARLVTFRTEDGDLNVNLMLYTEGRATVRRIELPRGLIRSLQWRAQ